MTAISVRCDNVRKSFGLTSAVRGVSLDIEAGEILALLGPSGCGKTTLMRLISGFERPEGGRIIIGERLVASQDVFVPPEKRKVGMVFQNFALFPHLTVGGNVAYGLKRRPDRAARIQEVLKMVGLPGLEHRLPHTLSGGQQQRVALARALAPEPQIVLLDEPFSGLDAGLRDQVRGEVRRILRASGATVIVVTHSQEEALFMGDRVAVMNAGMLEQIDRPEKLFLTPASRFVAEFIGATFFIDAVITPDGLDTEIGFLAQAVSAGNGSPVDVAVRTDDLALIPDPQGDAHVTSATYRGGSYIYDVRLPSGNIIRGESPHTRFFEPGTAIRVELTPGHPLAYFPK